MVNMSTGLAHFVQDANKLIQPASLAKILSLYLAYKALQQGCIHYRTL
jgi:D-alanyl-D-alanine carboxypeptidase